MGQQKKSTEGESASLASAEIQQLAQLLEKLKPKKKRRRGAEKIKYLTEEEISRLFAAIQKPPFRVSAWQTARDYALFRVAYHRGLRAAEVSRLQMSDLRLRDDRIRFDRLKGSAGGEYHLTSSEMRALRAWLRVRGEAPGPLFPSRRGRGISQQMMDVLIKRYGAAAGLPREKCHMHALKHSCGTHLLDRGESIEDVKDHLGHRNIQNTMIYAQFTNKRRLERDRRLRDW